MQKPWNIPNIPVYSLATYADGRSNMNICTYVIPISMKPKLYAVAVYYNTKTFHNLLSSEFAVLQLLHSDHDKLVKKLGQNSGLQYDKEKYLSKKNLLTNWEGYTALQNTSACILLKKCWSKPSGDHELIVFEAIKHKSFHNDYLSIQQLRDKKIIRG